MDASSSLPNHDHVSSSAENRLQRYSAPLVLAFVLVVVGLIAWRMVANAFKVTIGVEGQRVVEIAGPRLYASPFTPGDAISLRVADVKPIRDGFRYDLRYIAYGPGQQDLGKFLMLAGNKKPDHLPQLTITVSSILPKDYQGELFVTRESAIDLQSNYRLWLTLSWLCWGALLLPLILLGRKHHAEVTPPPRRPSVTQRLEAILRLASRGELNAIQQADLEQLLLGFWSQRLNLADERLPRTLEQLKNHPIAGRHLALVERWIHSRSKACEASFAKEIIAELRTELSKANSEAAGAHA